MWPSRCSVCFWVASASSSRSRLSLPCLTSTLPSRSSSRRCDESDITTIPFSNVTVTLSLSLSFNSVRMPVFRCSPISWKMSGRPKSRIVPWSAIA